MSGSPSDMPPLLPPRRLPSAPDRLRALLAEGRLIVMPCCFDALSARLIEQAGFPLSFMSGFATSAARLGLPDTGLATVTEMLEAGRAICDAVTIPVIGDGDTGHGNALNIRRTVQGFARAGFAAVMIEDQQAPKRCGHVGGKQVVGRAEAVARIRAAVAAREAGDDILILARTDARTTHGLDEAIARARAFAEAGADILFVEAPESEDEMRRICTDAPGIHMANMLEGGRTPLLPPARLEALGFAIAAYPLTLLSAAMKAMLRALEGLKAGAVPDDLLMDFAEIRRRIGFDAWLAAQARHAGKENEEERT